MNWYNVAHSMLILFKKLWIKKKKKEKEWILKKVTRVSRL